MTKTDTETSPELRRLLDAGVVLPVDKPAGPTSHDIVARARRALRLRRVGHSGTLDPFATGLLLLCVGPATRLAEYLQGLPKTYLASARLGVSTDTLDRDGTETARSDVPASVDRDAVEQALDSFQGTHPQVPPQFSAKKVGGEAMHRKARRGESVSLPPSQVTVYEIELVSFDSPTVSFRVKCSAGTYVRSIARDLGDRLGTGAHLTELRREAVGDLDVAAALPASELDDPGAVVAHAITPLDALSHLTALPVSPAEAARILHGQALSAPEAGAPSGEGILLLTLGGRLIAVAEAADGRIRPRKVFSGAGAAGP
jgi:tRNA pseudouridine55 synthase